MEHTKDSDCTLNDCHVCTSCGVYHGEPCDDCGQRGFHLPYCCVADLAASQNIVRQDAATLRTQLDEAVGLLRRFADRQREDGSVRVDYIMADTTSVRAFLSTLDAKGGE